jgi:hypothetical protein
VGLSIRYVVDFLFCKLVEGSEVCWGKWIWMFGFVVANELTAGLTDMVCLGRSVG